MGINETCCQWTYVTDQAHNTIVICATNLQILFLSPLQKITAKKNGKSYKGSRESNHELVYLQSIA